jgi:hypothetical protein
MYQLLKLVTEPRCLVYELHKKAPEFFRSLAQMVLNPALNNEQYNLVEGCQPLI